MKAITNLIDELQNQQKIARIGVTIIEEPDKAVEFFRSSVYAIGIKIPELVSPDILDMEKTQNDFTEEPLNH